MSKPSFCLVAALVGACAGQPAPRGPVSARPPAGDQQTPRASSEGAPDAAEKPRQPKREAPPLHTRPRIEIEPFAARPPAKAAPIVAPPAPATGPLTPDATDRERAKLVDEVRLLRRLVRVAKKSERFDAQSRLADACAKMAAAALDEVESKKWMGESAQLYRALANDPAHAKEATMDRVLFGLGRALMSAGDPAGARVAYARLIKDYPSSRYVPDVYVAFADYYFEQASMDNAQRFYEKALMFPNAPVHAYAQYKLGWVYFNLQEFQRALESFVRVVEAGRGGANASAARLAHAAARDLVLAYAQIGRPDRAHAFFLRVDPGAAAQLLERLGDIYRDQGKLADLMKLRHEQVRREPNGPQVCEFQADVTAAALTLGDADLAAKELARLAALWTRLAASTAHAPETRAWCGDTTYALLAQTARRWHAESEATLDAATRDRVVFLYQTLVRDFADTAEAPAHHYYLADALWRRAAEPRPPDAALRFWRETAQAFERCIDLASASQPFLDDALVGAVLAYQNAIANADAVGDSQQSLRAAARALFERVVDHYPRSSAAAFARRFLTVPP